MSNPDADLPIYGLDAELRQKMLEKYDPEMERQAKEWITAVTGHAFANDFATELKSGVVLCELINKIQPGSIKKINKQSAPFMQMENISNYLKACESLHMPKSDMFQTVDLYEAKNVLQVVSNIHALGRHAQKISSFAGPHLGVKLADRNEREFTAEQLSKGMTELGFADRNASNIQKTISDAKRDHADKIIKSDLQAVGHNELGLVDLNAQTTQKYTSDAKRDHADKIIKSDQKAVGHNERTFAENTAQRTQAFISDAKRDHTDKIIKSDAKAVGVNETTALQANASASQKYASEAKRDQTDKIIKLQ